MLTCRNTCAYNLKELPRWFSTLSHHTVASPLELLPSWVLDLCWMRKRLHINLILQWTHMDSGSLSLQHHITGPCLSHGSLRVSAVFAVPFHPVFRQVNSSLSALMEDREGIHNQNQQVTPPLIGDKGFEILPDWVFCRAPMIKQNLITLYFLTLLLHICWSKS